MKSTYFRYILLCTILFSVLGCGQNEITDDDRNQIEFLISSLSIQRGPYRLAICQRLIDDYGDRAVPALIKGIDSIDVWIRRGCAFCLGHIGNDDAVAPLERRLNDPDIVMRLEVASSLCFFGVYRGVPLLITTLRHEESSMVRTAAWQTLTERFHENFGYNPSAPHLRLDEDDDVETRREARAAYSKALTRWKEENAAAVSKWEAWWESNKGNYLED